MENPIIVPFDLNTARKIKSGEIEGSVLINDIEIEFVYESKNCASPYNLLFAKKDGYGISAIYANTEGCKYFVVTIVNEEECRFDMSQRMSPRQLALVIKGVLSNNNMMMMDVLQWCSARLQTEIEKGKKSTN